MLGSWRDASYRGGIAVHQNNATQELPRCRKNVVEFGVRVGFDLIPYRSFMIKQADTAKRHRYKVNIPRMPH